MTTSTTKKFTRNDVTKILAFCALLLAAIIWVLAAFKVNYSILTLIKDSVLLSAISLPAYSFAKSLGRFFIFIFWIIFIIFVVALILSSFSIL